MTDCGIQWRDDMRRGEWDQLVARCPHSTILQSFAYAQTMREVHKQSARHGLVVINGQEAGLVQMQEVALLNRIVHFLSVDRGPLWFEGFGESEHTYAFTERLNQLYPARFGRKRRFIPEMTNNNCKIDSNWRKNSDIPIYKTCVVDLSPDIDHIRANFKQKWRNILNKSEKNGLNAHFDRNLDGLPQFLDQYMKDRMKKRYAGASPKFLASLAKYATLTNDCMLIQALDGKTVIAAILVFCHGTGATYQTGWTTPKGRDHGAHHFLLWQAIMALKEKGITHFDLGGYAEENEGLRRFKDGLNGQNMALIGNYY